jgi:hypothetical protein
MKKQNKWLDNFGKADNANESNVSLPEDFVGLAYDTSGRNYSPAWGGQFAMGGSIPGSPGFTYARTAGSAPSEGKYAKKTMPSAQNGKTTVSTSSPEYKQLYENRQIGRWLDENTFDSQVSLNEVTVRPQSYSMESLRDFTKAAMYGAPENLMKLEQVPTAALAETAAMLTGKPYDFSNINPNFGQWGSNQRDLSILGYENPEGFMQNAVNMGLSAIDPAMIVGLTRNPVKNLTRTFTDNLNYSKSINPTRYVAGDEIKPAFGYATRNNETVVRGDLPEKVKNFVQAHEDYHVYDFQKYPNSSDSFFRRELPANFFPALKDPIGFAATVKHSLTPERLSFYKKRLKENLKPTSSVDDVVTSGIDSNFLTRPLTPFTKNELTQGKHLYRKIGGNKGLEDLINKGGAQAPAPLKMKSGLTVDTPFFGVGNRPVETYSGIFAVETPPPSMSKYNWSNRVGGTNNYGVAPFDRITGQPIQNIPLDDLEVFRKKWFSNNYKKLDKQNLQKELKSADLQELSEKLYKWGIRGYLADQILNDGDLTGGNAIERIEGHFKNNDEFQNGGEMKFYQEGLDWKPKSMQDGGQEKSWVSKAFDYIGESKKFLAENVFDPVTTIGLKAVDYIEPLDREKIYRTVRPVDYPTVKNLPKHLVNYLMGNEQDPLTTMDGRPHISEEFWATAIGAPVENYYLKESEYKPSVSKDPNSKYYTIRETLDQEKLMDIARGMKPGEKKMMNGIAQIMNDDWYFKHAATKQDVPFSELDPLQRYTLQKSDDGSYVSIYDKYDFDNPAINRMLNPIEIYDRFYIDKKPKLLPSKPSKKKEGGVIKDNRGQLDHPGKITEIDSPYITMEGVPYPVIGRSNTGDTKLMLPGENYKFKGEKVTEYPLVAKAGGQVGINQLDAQPKKKLNQLLNFTNNPDKNWLDNLQ